MGTVANTAFHALDWWYVTYAKHGLPGYCSLDTLSVSDSTALPSAVTFPWQADCRVASDGNALCPSCWMYVSLGMQEVEESKQESIWFVLQLLENTSQGKVDILVYFSS